MRKIKVIPVKNFSLGHVWWHTKRDIIKKLLKQVITLFMLAEAFTFVLLPETKQFLKNNSIGKSR